MASPAQSRTVKPAPAAQPTSIDLSDPLFAPFLRHDRYGTYGATPQPLTEYLRLVLSACTLVPLRIALWLMCVVAMNLCTRAVHLLPQGSRARSRIHKFWCRFWSELCCKCLGFRRSWISLPVTPTDAARGHGSKPAAGLVCNHLSWADMVILQAQLNPSYVAKDGTQHQPLVGIISAEIQCIFVSRGSGLGSAGLIRERMLRKAADPVGSADERLVLTFPEGTCTNGRYLLPFKTGAFLAGVPLQAVVMQWDERDKNRVSVAWDTIDFVWHFFLCLCQPLQRVKCYMLPVYVPDAEEQKDPALYARNMRDYMLRYTTLAPSAATYDFKREMDRLPRALFTQQRRVAA